MQQEMGKCEICGEIKLLKTKCYYYDIHCACHSKDGRGLHVVEIKHCDACADKVKPPEVITVKLKREPISESGE